MTHRLKAANMAVTTLSAGMNDSQTTASVAAGAVLAAPPARIVIDSEVMEYGAKAGNDLSSITRGLEGTTAATHSSGAAVIGGLTAGTYDEIPSRDFMVVRSFLRV